ncbi:MAG: zinc ABC transporter substrate-binding protein [Zavarzinella sp.]
MVRRLLAIIGLFFFIGCDSNEVNTGAGKPSQRDPEVQFRHIGDYPIQMVATTGMVADLARNIGGPHVQVTQLMSDGIDPHQFKASPGDIQVLSRAQIILYNGLHLEGKMGDIFERLAKKKAVFAVGEYLAEERILKDENGGYDPHLWFDVALWADVATVVEKILVQYDPKHAAEYRQNSENFRKELLALDAEVRERFASIPAPQRALVTAHDAFRYFGRAYQVEVRGIQGISTESEAGVREINELIDFLKSRNISAVFVESSVSDKNLNALIEGCRAVNHPINNGGTLYSDAMGKEGTPEGTYIGMIRHNMETIDKALRKP